MLLFTGLRTGVNAVPAVPSGQVTPVTTLDRSAQEVAHESPQILPNSREFLYVVDSPKAASAGTYLGSLDGSVKVRLLPDPAVYAPPGLSALRSRQQPLRAGIRFRGAARYRCAGVDRRQSHQTHGARRRSDFCVRERPDHGRRRSGRFASGLVRSIGPIRARAHRVDRAARFRGLARRVAAVWQRDGCVAVDIEREVPTRLVGDGRTPAYASDESGTWEVYVQAFPVAGSKRGISVGGGAQPQWRRDGRELLYLSADHRLMSVDVQTDGSFRASKPRPLFRVPVAGGLNAYRRQYLPTADARQFLVDSVGADIDRAPITLLSNWTSFIGRK